MNIEKFRQAEQKYNELKERHIAGEISSEEMKRQLKSLMILDDTNRYWMIGGKSGKWYTYNNKEWIESNPYPIDPEPASHDEHIDTSDNPFPSTSEYSIYGDHDEDSHVSSQVSFTDSEQGTTTIDFGSEDQSQEEEVRFEQEQEQEETPYSETYVQNTYESAPQTRTMSTLVTQETQPPKTETISPAPHYKADEPVYTAPRPAPRTVSSGEQEIKKIAPPTHITIKQLCLLPATLFFGGFGSIVGVIFGAMFGIFRILDPIAGIFPMMLTEMRGKVFGGLLFAAVGGLAGFVLFAMFGALLALVYNTVASVFCGLRIKIRTE